MRTQSVVIMLLLGFSHVASAQVHGSGFVLGKVVDDKGAPLANVTLTATLARVGNRLSGSSNNKGEWRIVGMAQGDWEIVFEKPGYSRGQVQFTFETQRSRIHALMIQLKPLPRRPEQ